MELSERVIFAQTQAPVRDDPRERARTEIGARAARRSLRHQIAELERELADAFVTAYPMGGFAMPAGEPAEPRLLDLEELERVRDDLAERLRCARLTITELVDEHSAKRVLLERMLLEPGKCRFTRVSQHDLGEPGCGVWHVRPRLGLIGMLMGWWQVKLSSGCPLARGRGLAVATRPWNLRQPIPHVLRTSD
ncbi:MAG: hypothetical protein M3071_05015 [Actinomycetota bacterium]|nr:hypothetical protein [Actinomycetota bacterium]